MIRKETIVGPCRLLLGDCMEILPTLGKFDAVVTDPPYGISAAKKKAHSSIRDNDQWENKSWDDSRPPKEVFNYLLSRDVDLAFWGGNYFADYLPASSGWLCWRKPEAETGFSLADIELCWTNKNFAARCRTMNRRDGNDHPTQKPVELIKWTLNFVSFGTVVDPFMGSGTTGVACIKTGRQFTGIEIDEKYYDIAVRRCREAWGDGSLFDEKRMAEDRELFAGVA